MGEAESGKTVTAAFLAAQLARSNVRTMLLSAGDSARALLRAQVPADSQAGSNINLSKSPSNTVEHAKRAIGERSAQVLIIDSLDFAAAGGRRNLDKHVRDLDGLARTNKTSVLITCAPLFSWPLYKGPPLVGLVQMTLRTRNIGSPRGSSHLATGSVIEVNTGEHAARLRVEDVSSVISLVTGSKL
jgi:hypothetical protein